MTVNDLPKQWNYFLYTWYSPSVEDAVPYGILFFWPLHPSLSPTWIFEDSLPPPFFQSIFHRQRGHIFVFRCFLHFYKLQGDLESTSALFLCIESAKCLEGYSVTFKVLLVRVLCLHWSGEIFWYRETWQALSGYQRGVLSISWELHPPLCLLGGEPACVALGRLQSPRTHTPPQDQVKVSHFWLLFYTRKLGGSRSRDF